MKKILIILMVLFITKGINAKTGVPDTLAYLNQIKANKAYYIGKPFSVLLDSLRPSIIFFSPISWNSAYKDKETSTKFYFIKPEYMEDFGSYNFEIKWVTPLNRTSSDQIFSSGQYAGQWRTGAAQ
ncbi:hypothetical protein ACFSPU_02975 [Haoranjiania flava]|uniref:hypothetical protein n=1 Tax=Haoranjiania flava TaxID=1856322 RepID=UPI00362D8B59